MVERKYPWERWFSQSRFRLRQGKHYTCQPHSMAQQVRTNAMYYGVSVSIRIRGDLIVVTVTQT